MPAFIDLSGQIFGRLLVVRRGADAPHLNTRGSSVTWICRCSCGTDCVIRANKLRSGHTQSCGCLHREMSSVKNMRHGQSSYPNSGNATKEYNTWGLMRKRCSNPSSADYPLYGGRGIDVCKRWSESFEAFFLDMGAAPTSAHSIDRIDTSKGYYPDNCRWATAKEQRRNQRGVPILEHAGKALSPMEWAELTGISHKRIYARIKRGWSVERTLTTPTKSSVLVFHV